MWCIKALCEYKCTVRILSPIYLAHDSTDITVAPNLDAPRQVQSYGTQCRRARVIKKIGTILLTVGFEPTCFVIPEPARYLLDLLYLGSLMQAEHMPPVWEIRSSIPGRVKPVAYKINVSCFIAWRWTLIGLIYRARTGWVSAVIM